MTKPTVFKEARVNVTANGYTVFFKDYRGEYSTRDWFVAKTLDEVKKILEENFIANKDY